MTLSDYFLPIDSTLTSSSKLGANNAYGKIFRIFDSDRKFPSLTGIQIAIVGIQEERGTVDNKGCASAPDSVREKLYRLCKGNYNVKIADLGNLRVGHSLQDTYIALKEVCTSLLEQHIIPVIIGGSQDLSYAQYLAYEPLDQVINIAAVDSHFDLGSVNEKFDSHSWLGKIIVRQPNFLFNFSNLGYQSYFVGQESIDLMDNLFFDAWRLGFVHKNIEEAEPIVRNADMLSFDISAIRQSDAPGNGNATPNGLYGEEACQVIRYAGLTDKLTSIGFYEINPTFDLHGQTSHLVAQMIWYFIDGFYNRKKDNPLKPKSDFMKYRIAIKIRNMKLYSIRVRKLRDGGWRYHIQVIRPNFTDIT